MKARMTRTSPYRCKDDVLDFPYTRTVVHLSRWTLRLSLDAAKAVSDICWPSRTGSYAATITSRRNVVPRRHEEQGARSSGGHH